MTNIIVAILKVYVLLSQNALTFRSVNEGKLNYVELKLAA